MNLGASPTRAAQTRTATATASRLGAGTPVTGLSTQVLSVAEGVTATMLSTKVTLAAVLPIRAHLEYRPAADNPHRKDAADFGRFPSLAGELYSSATDGTFHVPVLPGSGTILAPGPAINYVAAGIPPCDESQGGVMWRRRDLNPRLPCLLAGQGLSCRQFSLSDHHVRARPLRARYREPFRPRLPQRRAASPPLRAWRRPRPERHGSSLTYAGQGGGFHGRGKRREPLRAAASPASPSGDRRAGRCDRCACHTPQGCGRRTVPGCNPAGR